MSEQQPQVESSRMDELIDSNELYLDYERAVLHKYFEAKFFAVNDEKTNPLKLRSFGEPPTKVTNTNVWIGNFYDAHNTGLLQELRIQVVINLLGMMPNSLIVGIPYILYPLPQPNGVRFDDLSMANAMNVGFAIEKLKKAGYPSVFIHCLEGIDRGPTVVWKYMTEVQKVDPQVARAQITTKRPISVIHEEWFNGPEQQEAPKPQQ